MTKLIPIRSRAARRSRLMVESLEHRQLLSASALSFLLTSPSTSLFPAVAGASNITVGHDGAIWYSANDALEHLGPDGSTSSYIASALTSGTPSAIISNLAVSADQSVWFAVAMGSGNALEHMTAAGQFSAIAGPTDQPIRNLTVVAGAVWFTQGGHSIGHVTNGRATLVTVPGVGEISGMTSGPDGSIWFAGQTNSGQGLAGKVAIDGSITTFGLGVDPSAITAGNDGNIYLAGGGALWRMTTSGAITQIAVAGGDPRYLSAGADGSIWFVDASNTADPIARLGVDGTLTHYATGIQGQPIPNSLTIAPNGAAWFMASSGAGSWLGSIQVSARVTIANTMNNAVNLGIIGGGIAILSGSQNLTTATGALSDSSSTTFSTTSTTPSGSAAPIASHVAWAPANEPVPSASPGVQHTSAAPDDDQANSARLAAAKPKMDLNVATATSPSEDPATFSGEFSIMAHGTLPPVQPPEPGGLNTEYPYDLGDGRSSRKQQGLLNTQRLAIPSIGQTMPSADDATAHGHDQAKPGVGQGAVIADRYSGQSSYEQPNLLAKWWRLAMSASAATGFDTWRRGLLKKVYW